MDYVSAGHFEVYEQLVQEGREFDDQEGLRESESLFDKIQETTDALLDLNDKYQETDDLDALKKICPNSVNTLNHASSLRIVLLRFCTYPTAIR